MDPLTEKQIRSSFVNCTKGEAARLKLPLDFNELPWEDLDFLGWVDPGARSAPTSYAATPTATPSASPSASRAPAAPARSSPASARSASPATPPPASPSSSPPRRSPRPRGNTVGIYVCSDLACSLYIRGKRQPKLRAGHYEETLTTTEKIDRARTNLNAFTAKITS